MLKHYEGEAGVFDYNDEEFNIIKNEGVLGYIGNANTVNLPEGCISTSFMFYQNGVLPIDFTLGDNFDTSSVVNMNAMFCDCQLPKGFSLGDKFNTSSVVDMGCMFCLSNLPYNFTLGDKFDTSSVKSMQGMFYSCQLPEGFTLGDKFDTSSVKDMHEMFRDCILPEGFCLGSNFNVSNVVDMDDMFYGCYYNGCDIYKYFNLKQGDNLGVIKALKGVNNGSSIDCQRVIANLIKKGKTLEEAQHILCNPYKYIEYSSILGGNVFDTSVIEKALDVVYKKLVDSCYNDISNLIIVNKYTVGEAQELLISKGLSKNIVNECLVKYLSQHIL